MTRVNKVRGSCASLAAVAAVITLGLAPSGAFAAGKAAPSIDLTSVTYTTSIWDTSHCAPVWHFTAQGVTGTKHAPWVAQGMVDSYGFFSFGEDLTRANNGQSFAIADQNGPPSEVSNDGASHTYQLTLFGKDRYTVKATSQLVTVNAPTTSSC